MHALETRLLSLLSEYVSDIVAKSILQCSVERCHVDFEHPDANVNGRLLSELKKGLMVFITDAEARTKCTAALEQTLQEKLPEARSERVMQSAMIPINQESDVVLARNKGWYLCQQMEFSNNSKVQITTAITELARNILQYAERGNIELHAIPGDRPSLQIIASDSGPGITDVAGILAGRYKSSSGLGLGLKGVKRMMDEFDIQTAPGHGTTVTARKYRQ